MELTNRTEKYPDYEKYLSKLALRRKKSATASGHDDRKPVPGQDVPLLAGHPHADIFPIIGTELILKDGTKLQIGEDQMKVALQYGSLKGLPELKEWLIELVKRLHDPPAWKNTSHPSKLDVLVTAGSLAAIATTFELILDEGDTLLTQNPTYQTMLCVGEPLGINIVGLPDVDAHGPVPSSLRELLQNWEDKKPNIPRPKAFYFVPTGDNPRGITWSEDRRRDIYQICHDFDLLILEDDAYYLTQFKRPLPKTLLSMDVDGRVIRFDSFSKVLAPGFRLGFITAPACYISKLTLFYQTSRAVSPYNQVIIMSLLRHWGHDRFLKQCVHVTQTYKQKAESLTSFLQKYMSDVAEWNKPEAGMFLWVKLKYLNDSLPVVTKCLEKGVLLVNGASNIPHGGSLISPFIRMAYSKATEEQMDRVRKKC
ncbi:hypothetical protein LOTGIDRAFT_208411 [Lottia gigantea]|uniref:Aminotransferase class I/classII large domain-containing protein n=1 Tax=Lottia gigantea TaxID=225164 RepID=V4B4H6_LOTGI|nr:hypothetical protein LOTGIDRAFT_208411 [Lottia gigantea]ESP05373.1 hypothetical protein LOTGIDRAFT_208411 [Lottia gigantea]